MHPYLKTSIAIWLLCILSILYILYGCAGNTQLVCRHWSVVGAFADSEAGYPVRIMSGPSSRPEGHSQHQALIDGVAVCRDG